MLPNKVVKKHQRGQHPPTLEGKPPLQPMPNKDMGNTDAAQFPPMQKKAQAKAFGSMR